MLIILIQIFPSVSIYCTVAYPKSFIPTNNHNIQINKYVYLINLARCLPVNFYWFEIIRKLNFLPNILPSLFTLDHILLKKKWFPNNPSLKKHEMAFLLASKYFQFDLCILPANVHVWCPVQSQQYHSADRENPIKSSEHRNVLRKNVGQSLNCGRLGKIASNVNNGLCCHLTH